MSGSRTESIEPWSAARAEAALHAGGGALAPRALLRGQWPAVRDGVTYQRIGALAPGRRPRLVLDAWMADDEVDALAARLGITVGGWDVMFATAWTWAWGGAPFALWSRRGRVLTVDGPGRATTWLGGERHHAVREVHAYLSPSWITRQVGLVTTGGQRVWLARAREPLVALDPTYDGLDLVADASWAADLARALAAALAVPRIASDRALA